MPLFVCYLLPSASSCAVSQQLQTTRSLITTDPSRRACNYKPNPEHRQRRVFLRASSLRFLSLPAASIISCLIHLVDPLRSQRLPRSPRPASFFTPVQQGTNRNERKCTKNFPSKGNSWVFQKFPGRDEPSQEWSVYSFQLAKFLSQLIASRRRKTPVHLDGEGKERKED